MLARIGFLATEQQYDVVLPDKLDVKPLARAVVTYQGPRELIFEPFGVRPDPDKDRGFARRSRRLIRGHKVSTYRLRQTPPYVAAFWQLADGYLYTFLDADVECGVDIESGIDTIVESLGVAPRATTPLVRYGGSLEPGDPRDPGQREIVTFLSADKKAVDALTVRIRREPEWAREGTSVQKWDNFAQASRTSSRGLCVEVDGSLSQADRLQSYAEEIAESAVPAG